MDVAAAMRRRGYGTTQTQLSRWEAGQRPRAYILPALAAELGCRVEDFFSVEEEDDEMPLSRDEAAQFFSLLGKAIGARA